MAGGIGVALTTPNLASPGSAVAHAASRETHRPNILVFLTDDHGQWAEHTYGNSELRTPNFDRLASTGVKMTQAFTTCPVCSPARASFFTGRMPSQHGIHDWLGDTQDRTHPALTGQKLISEHLHDAGYHTALVGKWHCGEEREPHPGFDYWYGYWVNQYPHMGEQNFSDQGRHVVEYGQQSPLLTNHALDFLKKHRSDKSSSSKPFFLYVSYVDTHSPHNQAPDDLVDMYQDATFRDIPDEEPAPCHGKTMSPKLAPGPEKHRRAEYYAAATSVDREVGRVLDDLKANGELENTLVVYTGDHGLNCGQHGIWEKGNGTSPQNFLDESIRIACTVSWPAGGILQNAECADVVNHCDTWATLLDVAGATPNAETRKNINSPGRSYLPQLRGSSVSKWDDAQISEYGNARMIRTAQHKLILRYPFGGFTGPNELYDLQGDPRETVNRYDDESLAPTVAQLTAKLNKFFETYSVPGRTGLQLEEQVQPNENPPWVTYARLRTAETKPPTAVPAQ